MNAWKLSTVLLAFLLLLLLVGSVVLFTVTERMINNLFIEKCKPVTQQLPRVPIAYKDVVKYCEASYSLFCYPTELEWVPDKCEMIPLSHERGFVLRSGSDVSICFRGTFDVADLFVDFETKQEEAFGGRVHSGVWKAYLLVQEQVRRAAEGASSVRVMGHSLGGALSILAAADLASISDSSSTISVTAIAPPKVGDGGFKAWVSKNLQNVQIHVNSADVVPIGPSGIRGYYVQPADPISFYCDNGTWAKNHMLSTYRRFSL